MSSLQSIKSRILIFTVMATLIPSVGLGLFSFRQNEALIADNVTHQLRTLASDANRELRRWIAERMQGVRALAGSDAVLDGLSHRAAPRSDSAAENAQVLTHYLSSVQEKLGPLLELTVLDPAGRVIASSAPAPAPVMLPENWPSTAAGEGMIIVPPHWDVSRATATLTIAVPVLSIDNQVVGVLTAVLDLRPAQPLLKYSIGAIPGNVVLLDRTGRPLLSTYHPINPATPLDPQLLQELRESAGKPSRFTGFGRRTVLGLVEAPRDSPFMVLVERDYAEVYRAWTVFRDLFLTLVIGLSLLLALVAWRIGRSIVMPLKRLTVAADRIAAGDLTVQLPVAQEDEVGRLTQVFNRMTDNLRQSHEEFEAASLALQKQNALLETLSVTDSLTGLFNRKKLDDILADQFARFKRNQRPFTVLMLDIDHFKALNDTYGHLAGDQVLTNVAAILAKSIRSVDYAARYGGEEFVIVLPETTSAAALEMAERIRAQVENAAYPFHGQTIAVTISIGVAHSRTDDATADAVVARADQELYQAKHTGRNRVHSAP